MHASNQKVILGVYNTIAKPLYNYTYLVLNLAREKQCLVRSVNYNDSRYLFTKFYMYKDNAYEPDFFHPNITEVYTKGVSDLDVQL